MLSKYKQNRTNVYVNLLESKEEKLKKEATLSSTNEENKPITHLLININVYTMDSVIDFKRDEIPGEIYQDLRSILNHLQCIFVLLLF